MFELIKKATAALHRWRARRITVGKLATLDDRLLQDIGIRRSQIRSVVDELLQATESEQVQTGPVAEARVTTIDVQTPFTYDPEHKDAA